MVGNTLHRFYLALALVILTTAGTAQQVASPATIGSFKVQCPATTPTHPTALPSGSLPAGLTSPAYTRALFTGQTSTPTGVVNGAIKCQEISGGDGYMTEG